MRETINLYLDDRRDCPEGFVVARTVDEAIKLLEEYDINILSLDHDLGEDEDGKLLPTGNDLVKYFCWHSKEAGYSVKRIYIHTDNPVGRKAMFTGLRAAQRRGIIDENIAIHHYSITPDRYSDLEPSEEVLQENRKI